MGVRRKIMDTKRRTVMETVEQNLFCIYEPRNVVDPLIDSKYLCGEDFSSSTNYISPYI